jgi:hypothetical protein
MMRALSACARSTASVISTLGVKAARLAELENSKQ